MTKKLVFILMVCTLGAKAQDIHNNPSSNHGNKFEELGTILPTPNEYRTASGAPGPLYWQQRADYDITCSLDEKKQTLTGSETVTYYNNSPNDLTYIWLQLDENQHSTINNANYQLASSLAKSYNIRDLKKLEENEKIDNGYGDIITHYAEVQANICI